MSANDAPAVGSVIATLESLRALRAGSVVVTPLEEAWQKQAGGWAPGGRDVTLGDEVLLAAGMGHLLLVHAPGSSPARLHRPVSEAVAEVREDIDAAVEDYRRTFPEPSLLAPNLELAVRAARLLAVAPALSREELIELIPAPRAPQNHHLWPQDELDVFHSFEVWGDDWRGIERRRDEAVDRLRREKVADAILAALGAQAPAPTREARP